MIPGENILNLAMSVIGTQTISYYKAIDRYENDIGQFITTYAEPEFLDCSVQPVKKSLLQQLGLDFQKKYITVYIQSDIVDIERDVSSDQIIFNDKIYQCLSSEDWFEMDGWKSILCVCIKNAGQ